MLIPYLLTFHWTKLLIFARIVCIKTMRIPLRPLRLFFVICLPWPPKNRFLSFTANSINKLMVWSPLNSALANIFMCSFKNKWLKDCPHSLKPVFYRRYVDDILVLKTKMIVVYLFQTSIFFVKKEKLSVKFIGERPSVVFIVILTAS